MNYTPCVSVIMTVYNGEKYLREAINSIITQTLTDFEFIIVDDGSTDSTPQILKEFHNDPRINIIIRRRTGRIPSLNYAWRCTLSNYVANLDADDLAEPTRLEKQLSFLKKHPNVGLLCTGCTILNEQTGRETFFEPPQNDFKLRRRLVRTNPFIHSSAMIPRKVLENLGGYDESLKLLEDYELWVRIARSYELACLPEPLVTRRLHDDHQFRGKYEKHDKFRLQCKILTHIRWQAWLNLSQNIFDIRFVLGSYLRQFSV